MSQEEIRFEYVYPGPEWYASDPIFVVKKRTIIETRWITTENYMALLATFAVFNLSVLTGTLLYYFSFFV